ncbi:MAG: protein-L-isoaspartate(D-aspartate) O-methyltransferase [Alphaproteobacteria bacterium]|nr:protein-L-isoaspartate(D-aspartate) O-methyltransferase [Alphaproteobacteria bacterium]
MPEQQDKIAAARESLLAEIADEIRETSGYLGKDALDPRVIAAIRKVPREEFVPASARDLAYLNRPLSIGHGQTISQPYIVAVMTDLLSLTPDARVLEIGTGCGYQTAILAELAARVHTVEVVASLADAARERLGRLGYANIEFRTGDGRAGWPEDAPYGAIIVTAAARDYPEALVEQLAPGGRMAVPIGRAGFTQLLTLVEKDEDGRASKSGRLPVAFVPLVEGH